jgi:hypothetical protein
MRKPRIDRFGNVGNHPGLGVTFVVVFDEHLPVATKGSTIMNWASPKKVTKKSLFHSLKKPLETFQPRRRQCR